MYGKNKGLPQQARYLYTLPPLIKNVIIPSFTPYAATVLIDINFENGIFMNQKKLKNGQKCKESAENP